MEDMKMLVAMMMESFFLTRNKSYQPGHQNAAPRELPADAIIVIMVTTIFITLVLLAMPIRVS